VELGIYSQELCIGHVGKEFMSIMTDHAAHWHWTFGLNTAARKGFPLHGSALTFEEAKAIIEQGWDEWLRVAGLSEITS
jgi:hypothetical protein